MKTNLTYILRLFAGTLSLIWSAAQTGLAQEPSPFWNPELEQIAKPGSEKGWIEFREAAPIQAQTLFRDYRRAFRLGPNDDMRLLTSSIDDRQFTHTRYQQFYRGVRIMGAEFILHEDAFGDSRSGNGVIVGGLDRSATPRLTERQALAVALRSIDPTTGLWNTNEPSASDYYPQGELVFQRRDRSQEFSPGNLALAWRFDLHLQAPATSKRVFIDAENGAIFLSYPLETNCTPGTAATPWYGNQSISVQQVVNGNSVNYRLFDDCAGSHPYTIHTYQEDGDGLEEIWSGNTSWSNGFREIAGGAIHWGVHKARDYYHFVHNRDSWDGNNADIVAYADLDYKDAQWRSNNRMRFGLMDDTNPNNDATTLDIVGHEFTHGVTGSSAGLVYEGESGALNESFSDIFGEMVEAYVRGSNDWLMGNDWGWYFRNLSDPNDKNDPDAYKGSNWVSTSGCDPDGDNDFCGVHTNSGVQNFWFYLLSEGGSGTNEFGETYSVDGIGIDKAAAIAYRSLTRYLTSESDFFDARKGSLRAARDLFGSCSFEEIQVGKAWYAVHVGNTHPRFDYEICGLQTSGFFQGINSVLGGAGCATTVVPSLDNVTFAAGNLIVLSPGFSATASGDRRFTAYLEPCSFTVRSPALTAMTGGSDPIGEREAGPTVTGETAVSFSEMEVSLKVYPNPARTQATIDYRLPAESSVQLRLFTPAGAPVRTLYEDNSPAGAHQITIDTGELPAGVYLCRLQAGSATRTVRLTILH